MTRKVEKLKLHKDTVQRLDAAPQPAAAPEAAASGAVRCFTDGHFTCVC